MEPYFTAGGATVHLGDVFDVLPTLPDASVDAIVTDLAAGTAAEHLVCADLLLAGFRAFLADQNCPYDVAVDLGNRLVRIQVKATRGQRSIPQRREHIPAYMWNVRRAGKGGKRLYQHGDFDLRHWSRLISAGSRTCRPVSTSKQSISDQRERVVESSSMTSRSNGRSARLEWRHEGLL